MNTFGKHRSARSIPRVRRHSFRSAWVRLGSLCLLVLGVAAPMSLRAQLTISALVDFPTLPDIASTDPGHVASFPDRAEPWLAHDPWMALRTASRSEPVSSLAAGGAPGSWIDQEGDERPGYAELWGASLIGTVAGGGLGGLLGGLISSGVGDGDEYDALGGVVIGSTLGGLIGSSIALHTREVDGHPSGARSVFGSTLGAVAGWAVFIPFQAADDQNTLAGILAGVVTQSFVSALIAHGSGG